MKAVRHLTGLRGAEASALSVLAAAVAADDLDARVSGEPRRKAAATPVRQEIHDVAPFEIDEAAPIGASATQGEVVDAQDARRRLGRKGLGAHPGEHGVATTGDAELAQQPRAGLAAEREGDVLQPGL